MITMLASGLWHGANWTFVWWGGIHGILLIINAIYNKITDSKHYIPKILAVLGTWISVTWAWVFFRANSLNDAISITQKIFTEPGNLYRGDGIPSLVLPILMIVILMIKEIKDEYNIKFSLMHNKNPWISIPSVALMIIVILLCAEFNSGKFIYFQF